MLDSEEVERRRKDLDLTQEAAAGRAGLSGGRQHWSDIVAGRRKNITLDTLDKLAKALECSPKDLVR